MAKDFDSRVVQLAEQAVQSAGCVLVRARVAGQGKYAALQIMAERADGTGATIDDCAAISRAMSALLEADPSMADRYDLEVSSPGLERPLVKLADYDRFKGRTAAVELNVPIEGMKKFEGEISSVTGDFVSFALEKNVAKVPFNAIERAKLVVTEELIQEALKKKASD